MSYICSVCGKHYASKADMYACMSEDYKKQAAEAEKETNVDLKLHLYEEDILAAANKLKEQIARYNAYAREHNKSAYKGKVDIANGTRKIACSFFPSISRDPIKVDIIPDKPVTTSVPCGTGTGTGTGTCTCGKKEEQKTKPSNEKKSMTMDEVYDFFEKIDIDEFLDNFDDPNYWIESGLIDACNVLTGSNVTKEDVEKNINKALNSPLIQYQADMLKKYSKPKKFEISLEDLLNEALGKEKK